MKNTIQIAVRFPVDVKLWLEQESERNGSSQNSEVIRALRAAMSNAGVK